MRLTWIIVLSLGYADPLYTANRSVRKWIQSFSVPWVGVLSHRETKFSHEALSGITLIKTKYGLSNAHDMVHITKTNIRNTTKAIFLAQEGAVRYATVTNYVIHPEFDEDTLNTIALVRLDYDEKKFDYNTVLEQVMHTMEFVDLRECNEYYKQEGLDSQWSSPTEYQCFQVKNATKKCVFESGMTLAVYHLRRWKLLGISVLGPGCALPTRFIDFASYVPWVQQQIADQHRDTHVSKFIRRGMHHM